MRFFILEKCLKKFEYRYDALKSNLNKFRKSGFQKANVLAKTLALQNIENPVEVRYLS